IPPVKWRCVGPFTAQCHDQHINIKYPSGKGFNVNIIISAISIEDRNISPTIIHDPKLAAMATAIPKNTHVFFSHNKAIVPIMIRTAIPISIRLAKSAKDETSVKNKPNMAMLLKMIQPKNPDTASRNPLEDLMGRFISFL